MSGDTKVPVLAGTPLRAIVPDSLDSAFRLATAFVAGGITPRGMQRPEQVMIAILAGMEVGLTPLQAVQGIYIVNGRPTLFGDSLVAVVRGSGRCAWIKEWIEGSGDTVAAFCETLRVGEPEPVRRSFSWAQAKKAGLAGKEGPWTTFPARMLAIKARNFCLRDVYADVLRGLSDDSDDPAVQDIGALSSPDSHQTSNRRTPPDPDMPEVEAAVIEEMSETKSGDVSDDGPPDPGDDDQEAAQQLLGAFQLGLKLAKTADDVDELWADLEIESSLTHDEDALAAANALKEKAIKRLSKAKK